MTVGLVLASQILFVPIASGQDVDLPTPVALVKAVIAIQGVDVMHRRAWKGTRHASPVARTAVVGTKAAALYIDFLLDICVPSSFARLSSQPSYHQGTLTLIVSTHVSKIVTGYYHSFVEILLASVESWVRCISPCAGVTRLRTLL